jgi:hypothetical protein
VSMLVISVSLPIAGWLGRRDIREFDEKNRRDRATEKANRRARETLK